MSSYFRLSANAEGELADKTIINPIESNNKMVINKVKSMGLFKKLEKLFSFFFLFAIFSFLSFRKRDFRNVP